MEAEEGVERANKKRGRPVSIQTQLLLGTGVILALASIIAVVGYATLRQLQTGIQTTLQEASQIRESSLLIENEFLTTRQNEASFLSNWQTLGYETAFEQYVVPGTSHLETAGAELDRIGQLVQTAHDSDLRSLIAETSNMGPLLDNYKTAFLTTVAQVEQRTRGGGLEKDLASELSWLEKAVAPLPKAELLTLVLQLRASEQAYLNAGRQEDADNER